MESSINTTRILKASTIMVLAFFFLAACGATLPDRSTEGRHIPLPETELSEDIPEIVESSISANDLPENSASQPTPDLYSVVAQDLPVRELLFTIARDAGINIDVHPDVAGRVSLNAVDQTLPQILDRISRQTKIRWSVDSSGNLLIEHDQPYWRTYTVNYVNVQRNSSTSAEIATAIGGSGGNSSSSSITQSSENNFWPTLIGNLAKLAFEEKPAVEETGDSEDEGEEESSSEGATESDGSENVIANPESGVIVIKATANKHQEVQSFLNFVESRALQQVMIEATVVEVTLNDRYRAGVDWSKLSLNGEGFTQSLTAGNISTPPNNVFTINNGSDISATVRALSQFGDSQVLSSPKIMALNNQSALLRVVDNRVYFTIDVEPATFSNGELQTVATFETAINTVPVGFSMSVTPQVGDSDQVTLNVRPTISRIVRFVNDPNPILAQEGVTNAIPEIQIREMESVLKVYSGQTAVLGGLMQDSLEKNTDGLPTVSRVPVLGNLFSYRDDTASKSELIIFIKPVVVHQPSLDADLKEYRHYLPAGGGSKLNTSKTINSDFWGR